MSRRTPRFPEAVASGAEPFWVIGAIADGYLGGNEGNPMNSMPAGHLLHMAGAATMTTMPFPWMQESGHVPSDA
jgi:hypothetical protein